jgi:hypothetical protein
LQLSGASRYLSSTATRRTDGFIDPCAPAADLSNIGGGGPCADIRAKTTGKRNL